ncbi:MAG: VWA domain-containing protein [Bryobacteraceae bacterium]
MKNWIALFAATALLAQQPAGDFKISVTTKLVIVNVEVKDGAGKPLENLPRTSFEITEDGKPQTISVFEYQRLVSDAAPLPPAPAAAPGAPLERKRDITPSPQGQIRYKDKRLMVLFFDFSSMETAEQIRAQRSAEKFLSDNMTEADLVAIMAFSTKLSVLQDFTEDRETLLSVIRAFRPGETAELAIEGEAGETENGEDTGAAFTADDTEFNIFNTDRKLGALETAVKMLQTLPEKKAFVYFSSGIGKSGSDNESQLRSTVNAAIRANVAFYPVDARGLVAEAPGGDSRRGSTRGNSMYSGGAQRQRQQQFNNQQETLETLAADTGGKSFLDNNDLALGIVQAQQDISSYYVLGYYSTNPAEDGKYRRIKVRLTSDPKAKIDYRSGYFAPKQFKQFTSSDKERQLEEALLLGDPITDLPLALEVNYFRRGKGRYIVPVSVKIPGSTIELARKRKHEEARLDFIGQVRETGGALAGNVRDFIEVKLTGENAAQIGTRHLQYDTAFTLPPGDYTLKFLARENETGRMGTFETRFTVPDLDAKTDYLRLSSVVWANQREPVEAAVGGASKRDRKAMKQHPLVQNGKKLIPSIHRVVRRNQELYVYVEAYDAATDPVSKSPSLAATVSLFRGKVKTFETEPYRLTAAADRNRVGLPVELDVPLANLAPGEYVCQINVVDEAGKRFAFRRTPLVVLP